MIVFDKIETGNHAVFVEIASRSSVVISWWLRPTNEDVSKAVVNIARAYSPTGPFVSVADVPGSQTYYRDANALLRDKWREIYYKLKVTSPDGGVDETGPYNVRSQPTMETIATRRRTDLALRLEGVPCLIYPRREEGERCPDCWDPVLKKVLSSSCSRCFNTGRLGGYYLPVLTQVKINPVTKTNQPGDTLRQVEQTTAMCSFVPIVKPRDIIYEVNAGKRWRLVTVTPTEHHRVVIHQDLTMVGLNPGDIEHQLPIPTGLYPLIPEWRDERIYPQRPLVRDPETKPEGTSTGQDVDFLTVDL
jgi:hypothetical protein